MAFRDWRARRILALSLSWPLLVLVWLVLRGRATAHSYSPSPDVDVVAVGLLPLNPLLWLGPPVALLIAWWIARRSRPAG